MAAKNITGKLGNMRKAVEWVLYPQNADEPHIVIIQCDKRIAKVNTLSAIAILSDETHTVEDQGTFRIIYSGTWGNYNSPGASHYTSAELYDVNDEDEMAEFEKDKAKYESAPEWLETDDEDDEDDEDTDDEEEADDEE